MICKDNNYAAFYDKAPVNKGHAIVIPKEHIISLFDFPEDKINELFIFIKRVKEIIEAEYKPDGYNIGVNEGIAAGRSVDHLHIHIIPRYKGDITQPIGGIRNILGKNILPVS